MKVMISLVGEQPIPNLLAIRSESPDIVVLVYSGLSAPVTERLLRLSDFPEAVPCPVMNAYDFSSVRREIERVIRVRKWNDSDLVFNLTGGTKAMALAAYEIAKTRNSSYLYLQSEGRVNTLYTYEWLPDGDDPNNSVPVLAAEHVIPGLINVDEYIRVHVGEWKKDDRNRGDPSGRTFEQVVTRILVDTKVVDEIRSEVRWSETLEADLIMRKGGNFAIAEIKQGKSSGKKDDLQQIAMITQQRVFGTYIQPILIVGKTINSDIRYLAENFGIAVIELPSWEAGEKTAINPADTELLRNRISDLLTQEGAAA